MTEKLQKVVPVFLPAISHQNRTKCYHQIQHLLINDCEKVHFFFLTFYHAIPTLNNLEKEDLENIVGKGENAGNQYFLFFPQCFLPFQKQISIFWSHSFWRLQMFPFWTSLKYCRLVKTIF